MNPKPLPRAYQEGTVNFYGFDFGVNSSTLIPRPETEQLVERTVVLVKQYLPSRLRILDIGTGSGIIAITLKKLLPDSEVEASDISPEALKVARQNANNNEVKITFRRGSLFQPVSGQFDLIIANLPYVPAARWRFLESQVRDFEPKGAIVAGRDGLKLLKQFCQTVGAYLNQPSLVALEIDDSQGVLVQNLLQIALPDHRVYFAPDLAHKVRFVFAIPRV